MQLKKSNNFDTKSVSSSLVKFAVDFEPEFAPSEVKQIAQLSLFDWFIVSIAGQMEPVSQIVRNQIKSEGGNEDCSVIGTTQRFPARAAALANGTISHALDYDDTHFAYLGHPSVAIMPAALAIGEKTNVNSEKFLSAVIVGLETVTRIGAWLGRDHHLAGYHSTATAGAFGATIVASKLLNLDEKTSNFSLGLVSSMASGVRAQFGTMAKPLHAGMAAANGVEAALLAQAGLISNPDALEVEHGFAETHTAKHRDAATALDGLGKYWMLKEVLHKYHACCHGLHPALEALIQVRKNYNLIAANVERVSISVPARYLKICHILNPNSGLEAKFSFRLSAAMVLAGQDTAALSTFSNEACYNGDLLTLRDRVSVLPDTKLSETEAFVQVQTTNGEMLSANYDINKNQPYKFRKEKIMNKAFALLGESATLKLWDLVATGDPMEFYKVAKTGLT
jgi:2-methylcitrate dehydratase PrpD